jgi:hypothetical protein
VNRTKCDDNLVFYLIDNWRTVSGHTTVDLWHGLSVSKKRNCFANTKHDRLSTTNAELLENSLLVHF